LDPTRADTVEDAAWNCIVDLADANPDGICSDDVAKGPLQDLADKCALGDVLMFDNLYYTYCKGAGNSKSTLPSPRFAENKICTNAP
jgi:hypothetical protein